MRGKGRKKAFFRPENPNVALAAENRRRDGDRLHSGYQYAEPHSRHWPESSIKSSQANAGGEMLFFARNVQAGPQPFGSILFIYSPASIGLRFFTVLRPMLDGLFGVSIALQVHRMITKG